MLSFCVQKNTFTEEVNYISTGDPIDEGIFLFIVKITILHPSNHEAQSFSHHKKETV